MLTWKFIHDRVPSEFSFKVRSFFSNCLPWFVAKPNPNLRELRAFVDERHYSYDIDASILGAPVATLLSILDKFPEESSLCQAIAGEIFPGQFRSAMSFVSSAKGVAEKSAEARPSKSTWYERLKKKFFGESASEIVQVKLEEQNAKLEAEHKSAPVRQLMSHLSIQSKIPDVNYLHKLFFENEAPRDELKNYFAKSTHAENVTFLEAVLDKNLVVSAPTLLQRLVNYLPRIQQLGFVNELIKQAGDLKHKRLPPLRSAILQGKLNFFTSEQTPFVANRAHLFLDDFLAKLASGRPLVFPELDDKENLKLTVKAIGELAINFPADFLLRAVNKIIDYCEEVVQAAIEEIPGFKKPKTRDIDSFKWVWSLFRNGEWINRQYTAVQELQSLISRLVSLVNEKGVNKDENAVSALEWMGRILTLHQFKETAGLRKCEAEQKELEQRATFAKYERDEKIKRLRELIIAGQSVKLSVKDLKDLHPNKEESEIRRLYEKVITITSASDKQDVQAVARSLAEDREQGVSFRRPFGMGIGSM